MVIEDEDILLDIMVNMLHNMRVIGGTITFAIGNNKMAASSTAVKGGQMGKLSPGSRS